MRKWVLNFIGLNSIGENWAGNVKVLSSLCQGVIDDGSERGEIFQGSSQGILFFPLPDQTEWIEVYEPCKPPLNVKPGAIFNEFKFHGTFTL